MPPSSAQTIRLSAGRHEGPQDGACVMELASMLAGTGFSDRPAGACPVLAAFLRGYNDGLPDAVRHAVLVRWAADAIGSRSGEPRAADVSAALVERFARPRLGRWARAAWHHSSERDGRAEYLGGRCGRWAGTDPQRHAEVDGLLEVLVGDGPAVPPHARADLDGRIIVVDACRMGVGLSRVDHVVCASERPTPERPGPCTASAGGRCSSWRPPPAS